MNKPNDPRELATDLLPRSICTVQVAAVIADDHGIFGWGWNSVGSGLGEHAEAAAIRRSSRGRLEYASIYIASQRQRNQKLLFSRPCDDCAKRIRKVGFRYVYYRDARGIWLCEEWL